MPIGRHIVLIADNPDIYKDIYNANMHTVNGSDHSFINVNSTAYSDVLDIDLIVSSHSSGLLIKHYSFDIYKRIFSEKGQAVRDIFPFLSPHLDKSMVSFYVFFEDNASRGGEQKNINTLLRCLDDKKNQFTRDDIRSMVNDFGYLLLQ